MDFHLDYGLRLCTDPEYKSLYNWAINEVGADGISIGRDQIPWPWTLLFSVTSCSLTDQFEIDERLESVGSSQTIRMTLRPTSWRNDSYTGDVIYSMLGTDRVIRDFTLQVLPLVDATKAEQCSAWGSVAYTSEIDFRSETTEDCLLFYLHVKPETFGRYVALVDQGAIKTALFSVGSADGFYSDWSPSISTDHVKVLARGSEQKIGVPDGFQDEIPRLGQVREARLQLHRHFKLGQ